MAGAQELRIREMRDEISQLKAMVKMLAEQHETSEARHEARHQEAARQIKNLMEENAYLKSRLYSPSREKLQCEGQLSIFNEAEELHAEITPEQLELEKEDAPTTKKSRKPRTTNAEKFKDLPKKKVVHQLPKEKQICDICGNPLTRIGEEYLYTEL